MNNVHYIQWSVDSPPPSPNTHTQGYHGYPCLPKCFITCPSDFHSHPPFHFSPIHPPPFPLPHTPPGSWLQKRGASCAVCYEQRALHPVECREQPRSSGADGCGMAGAAQRHGGRVGGSIPRRDMDATRQHAQGAFTPRWGRGRRAPGGSEHIREGLGAVGGRGVRGDLSGTRTWWKSGGQHIMKLHGCPCQHAQGAAVRSPRRGAGGVKQGRRLPRNACCPPVPVC